MTLLAAGFLAGLVALAVPLWVHRVNQRAPAEATVASLMLLREVKEPVRNRRTLAHKALLALRLLLLVVVVLAFAQPAFEAAGGAWAEEAPEPARLVVVDGSLSMRRPQARAQAEAAARRLLAGGKAPTRLARAASAFTLVADVGDAAPGWARLDLSDSAVRLNALVAALPESPAGWGVTLISDFQASGLPERGNDLVGNRLVETAKAREVVLHRVRADTDNWTVESVRVGHDRVTAVVASFAERPGTLAVTLTPRPVAAQELTPSSHEDGVSTSVVVPAGGRGEVEFDLPALERGPLAWEVALRAAEDALAEDDVRLFVRPGSETAPVGVVAANPHGEAAGFLRAALTASARADHVVLGESAWPRTLAALVAAAPGETAPAVRRRLHRYVEEGGGALLIAGPAMLRQGVLPVTGEALTAGATTPRRVRIADPTHPVVAGEWNDVIVRRSLRLPASAGQTLLALVPAADAAAWRLAQDSLRPAGGEEPLLVEKRVGKGRVLVLLTALERSWSDLVVRPAFVSLIANVIDHLAHDKPLLATVGEPIAVGATAVRVFDERGERLPGLGGATDGRLATASVLRLERPGVYTVRTPGRQRLLAVNVDARESDLRPVADEFLAAWQAALQPRPAPVAAGRPAATGETVPLAGWLLAIALACLLAECLFANIGWSRIRRLGRTRVSAA